jgi:translation initiation factor 3 subunit L
VWPVLRLEKHSSAVRKIKQEVAYIIMVDDACLPTVVTDFIFDLYDSVTTSQIPEEQSKLYESTLPDLSSKYFGSTPWPSVSSIAQECNGDPLFLAVYRELTHRHWHNLSHRPSLELRLEGWDVYRELFDEILDATDNLYLLPVWVFEIMHEFVYQYQGFCQIHSIVYSTAIKNGLLDADLRPTGIEVSNKQLNLQENLLCLKNNQDAWDTEAVFSYLHRLIAKGFPSSSSVAEQPVHTYFAIFGSIALSRLECLLGDFTGCLRALDKIHRVADTQVIKEYSPDTDAPTSSSSENQTVAQVLGSVFAARLSLTYHAGIAYLMLRRYKDASMVLAEIAGALQRGFKSGNLRHQAGFDQFNKQYDRILSLLAILQQVCPGMRHVEEAVMRVVREKHGSKIETTSSYEEWFQSPKFISADYHVSVATDATSSSSNTITTMHRQQVEIFNKEMSLVPKKLRSYLKLYTALPVAKLAKFHDLSPEAFLPLLLSYKARMRQRESSDEVDREAYDSGGTWRSALDIHFYVETDIVLVDEAEKQRRFEQYFLSQINQTLEIQQAANAIDTNV